MIRRCTIGHIAPTFRFDALFPTVKKSRSRPAHAVILTHSRHRKTRLIGTKGQTIRSIQGNTRAKIYIPGKDSVNDKVVIVGTPPQVAAASSQVEKALARATEVQIGRFEGGTDAYDDGPIYQPVSYASFYFSLKCWSWLEKHQFFHPFCSYIRSDIRVRVSNL